MIHFIFQARSGSTRMPNKILLPFYDGKSILDLLIEKLKRVKDTQVIIATSVNPNCDPIEEVAKKHEVLCFRGSENDVLQRFIDAAEAHLEYSAENYRKKYEPYNKVLAAKAAFQLIFQYMHEHIQSSLSLRAVPVISRNTSLSVGSSV